MGILFITCDVLIDGELLKESSDMSVGDTSDTRHGTADSGTGSNSHAHPWNKSAAYCGVHPGNGAKELKESTAAATTMSSRSTAKSGWAKGTGYGQGTTPTEVWDPTASLKRTVEKDVHVRQLIRNILQSLKAENLPKVFSKNVNVSFSNIFSFKLHAPRNAVNALFVGRGLYWCSFKFLLSSMLNKITAACIRMWP